MHKNILLLKDEVGKTKPVTRDLPEITHRYGKVIEKDKFNAKACLDW